MVNNLLIPVFIFFHSLIVETGEFVLRDPMQDYTFLQIECTEKLQARVADEHPDYRGQGQPGNFARIQR